ncbi:flagellar filament capping protein FliD [Thorsellia anophelis]|uniref:Flagellar hook-associated protein 2 n=1 Tax=Thorsellia anophelis DSM 18579 TaxID=1123402 RepID=A0A1H9ZES0_9GAMM|nr:flagellar filament capping protein FliD [Thorsellia anophelis]SES80079.1 flagellar hook-associated protein 2 [Thorsellia anophelis DSM 18579]
MAGISSLGVGSGLDLQGLLDQLQAAEQTRLTPLTAQKTTFNNQITAWGIVKSSVAKLDAAAQNLQKANEINTTAVSSTNKAFSASVSASANPGSYSVNVQALATGQISQATIGSDKNSNVINVADGATTLTFAPNTEDGKEVKIEFEAGDYTLEDVRNKINESKSDVSAEIIYDAQGKGYLNVSSKSTGEDAGFTVQITQENAPALPTRPAPEGEEEAPYLLNEIVANLNDPASQRTTAADAVIQVNGITVTSGTNTFKDVVDGVTITAKEVSPSTGEGENKIFEAETLSITKSTGDLKAAIQAYVDAFNEVQATISNQTKFVPGKAGEELSSSNGDLMGNAALRNLQNQLRSQITSSQEGAISTLNSLGIKLNNTTSTGGSVLKLEINGATLDKALADNVDGVINFLVGDGKTTGFATQSANQLKSIMDNSTGVFKVQEDSLNSMIKRVERSIENTTSSIEANLERTRIQFEQLDRMMAQMNSTSAYLTQQLASLSAQTKQ